MKRARLITAIQNAHAGEKAAANAYWGHAYSLFVRDSSEKQEILDIMNDELDHRAQLKQMLDSLGARPSLWKEALFFLIGSVIAVLCVPGTWFIPMYGAGLLESKNIEEYEVLARLAFESGEDQLVESFLHFAEVEWDHELYFRTKAESHYLAKVIPLWPQLPPRTQIRDSFQNYVDSRES